MDVDEFLEGSSLTGRQALLIFFGFLFLIVLSALVLILFSDFFQGLVGSVSPIPVGSDGRWVRALPAA